MGRAVQHHASTEPCGGALDSSTLECLNSGRDSSGAGQATSELGPRPSLSVTIEIQAEKGAAPAAPAAAVNKGSLLCLELGRLATRPPRGCVLSL